MQFDDVVKERRTVREFLDKPVPERVIEEILSLAGNAPSSMNGQPWHFIVVRNRDTLEKLIGLKNYFCPPEKQEFQADFIRRAPVVIFVCVNREKSFDRGVENAVLATAYILLAACSRGLSGVYMSAYRSNAPEIAQSFRELLEIPADFDPVTLIPLGYPAVEPPAKSTTPLEEMVSHEAFSKK